MSVELGEQNRGKKADYAFGFADGWGAVQVIRWHAVEELSRAFEYEITLLRLASQGPLDLDAMIDAGASFRIATETRWRVVHGILAEAEELDRTSTMILYRVLLVPHLWRSRHRRRCRTFVDMSLQEIVPAVLENRSTGAPHGLAGLEAQRGEIEPPDAQPTFSGFVDPKGKYRIAVADHARWSSPRSYVVQYNESDYDFLCRLLETEGISFYFEHAADADVLMITDRPGVAPLFDHEAKHRLRGVTRAGDSRGQEVVRTLRNARRLRPRAVTMRDFAWRKSRTLLESTAAVGGADADALGHFEFPARDEDDPRSPGLLPSRIRLERFETERMLRSGSGTVRTMEPGKRFRLEDTDALREDVELLIVRVETFAAELSPEGLLDAEEFGFDGQMVAPAFESRFEALPADVAFRPERATPKPLILGIQSARVTATQPADAAERVDADEQGQVRVRFAWDQRLEEGKTSKWVRVSQYWAGAGYGALYTPRVGHEVLVAHLDGDPDKPVIIGRVYNAQNPPPYDPKAEPFTSTLKSQSSEGAGFNELRFNDLKGSEEVYLQAEKNLSELVKSSHSTSVGGDQSNSVGGSQSNKVVGNRSHIVDGRETNNIATGRATWIGAPDTLYVNGTRGVEINGAHTVLTHGTYSSTATSNHELRSTNTYVLPSGTFQCDSTTAAFNQSASFTVKAAGCTISLSAGCLTIDNGAGASISMVGNMIILGASTILSSAAGLYAVNSGGPTNLTAGGDINASAATIKLNG